MLGLLLGEVGDVYAACRPDDHLPGYPLVQVELARLQLHPRSHVLPARRRLLGQDLVGKRLHLWCQRTRDTSGTPKAGTRPPGASCPAPQVRAVRRRLARVPRKYGTAAGRRVNAGQHCAAVVVLPALGESDLVPDEGRPADALPSRWRRGWRRRWRWRHVASGGEGGGKDGRLLSMSAPAWANSVCFSLRVKPCGQLVPATCSSEIRDQLAGGQVCARSLWRSR